MKLLKEVKPIEVKRCFVISDRTKRQPFAYAKQRVLALSEPQLNKILLRKNRNHRLRAYDSVRWYLGEVRTDEVGVWKGAGGLPIAWTRGSVADTGILVRKALSISPSPLKKRARTAIPGIMQKSLSLIQKQKYLLPIILPGGTMGRKGLRKMKGDIDDGCMRSVALAASGKKIIRAYIGVRNR